VTRLRILLAVVPWLALLLLVLSAAEAEAQCTISTAPVSFGSYDVLSATPRDSTGSVTFRCSLPVAVTIDLGPGQNASTFFPRYMTKGSPPLLGYNLFTDAARSTIWGDGSAGTSRYSNNSPPALTNVTLTVYGRIPAGNDVTAGSYADTVVATITF
jgi:spore coat protein U-like protein